MLIPERIAIEGLPLYEVQREHAWRVGNGWHSAWSTAFVCPRCLRRWAVLQLRDDDQFQIVAGYCEQHRPTGEWDHWLAGVPGSILHEIGWGRIDEPLLAALPEPLARREFDLHMRALDFQQQGNLQR